jgi:hypothetical protein
LGSTSSASAQSVWPSIRYVHQDLAFSPTWGETDGRAHPEGSGGICTLIYSLPPPEFPPGTVPPNRLLNSQFADTPPLPHPRWWSTVTVVKMLFKCKMLLSLYIILISFLGPMEDSRMMQATIFII